MRSAPASDASAWRNTLRRYDALVFFLMTLALTWIVWIPRAMGFPVGVAGRLWTWIPAITALVCAALLYGRAGLRDLGRRLVRWRVRWWWYPVVLVGPLVFSLIAAGIAMLLGQSSACGTAGGANAVSSSARSDLSDLDVQRWSW